MIRLLIFIIKLPIYILCIFLNLLLFIINFFYKIKIYSFDASAYSHFVSDYHYVRILSKKEKFKVIASVVGLKFFHNKYILECIKKEFIFNNLIFKYLDYVTSYMPWAKYIRCYDFRSNSSMDLYGLVKNNPKLIHTFSKKENSFCKDYLLSKGIGYNDKFVLINLRDDFFYNQFSQHKDLHNSTRNLIKFKDLEKSLKYLNKNFFKIIRWGRFKKKINTKVKILDLSVDKNVPHIMDFWLAKNCAFAIGSASGPDPIVGHFQNPFLILGHWPIYYIYNFLFCLTLLPKVKWLNSNKYLSITEMLNFQHMEINIKELKKKNVNFIRNNSQDIYLATIQLLNIYKKKPFEKKLNHLNQKFWQTFINWDKKTEKDYFFGKKIQKRWIIKKHPYSRIANISLINKKNYFFK
mgnify:CR=1 FL=1